MTVEDAMFLLPPGVESAGQQAPMPEARADLLDLEQRRQNHILFLFGIPAALGINSRSKVLNRENIGDNDFAALSRTLKDYQSHLQQIGTSVLQRMYDIESQDLELSVPMIPFAPVQQVITFYEQDIINFETAQKYALEIAGMSMKDAATEPNRHLRPPVRGSDNATTDMMAAKVAEMRADKKKIEAEAEKLKAEAKHIQEEFAHERKMQEMEIQKMDKEIEVKGAEMQLTEVKMKAQEAAAKRQAEAAKRQPAQKRKRSS